MKKIELIKDAKKIFIDTGEYTVWEKDYLEICEKFNAGGYNNIRNYYNEAKKLGYLNKDKAGTYAKELNRVLWSFLFANKKSSDDLKVLDTSINIFNTSTSTLSKIEDSRSVLEYLKNEGYETYSDLSKYFSDMYGIDIREYRYAKANDFQTNNKDLLDSVFLEKLIGLAWSSTPKSLSLVDYQFHFNELIKKTYEYLSDYEPVYNSTRTLDAIMPIIKKYKEEYLLLNDGDYSHTLNFIMSSNEKCEEEPLEPIEDDYSVLEREIKKKLIYPVYKQNYGLPTLQVIGSNKVVFEFNILDDSKDIVRLLKEIHKKEKSYRKCLYSSEKLGLLKELEAIDKIEKFNSISALQKTSIIYQYMQDDNEGLSLEKATYIYNFHVLLFECNDEAINVCEKNEDSGEKYITCKNSDIVTDNTQTKEIRKQIKTIKSLLNLAP